jgi:hypothetical protein
MEQLEQENKALREEVTSMKGEIEKLTAMMTNVLASQAHTSVPQVTGTSMVQPTTTVSTSTHQLTMPEGCPWGMPQYVFSKAMSVPQPGLSIPQATLTYSAPLVHINLQDLATFYFFTLFL